MTKKQLKTWGWILVLILPITGILWIIISIFFRLLGTVVVGAYDGTVYSPTTIEIIKFFINRFLGIVALIGIIGLPVGIVFLVKGYKKGGKESEENNVYIPKKR